MHTHPCVYTGLITFRLNKCSSIFPDHHLLCHIPHHFQPQLRLGFSKFIPAGLENISVFLLRGLSRVPLPHPPLCISTSCSWLLSPVQGCRNAFGNSAILLIAAWPVALGGKVMLVSY